MDLKFFSEYNFFYIYGMGKLLDKVGHQSVKNAIK